MGFGKVNRNIKFLIPFIQFSQIFGDSPNPVWLEASRNVPVLERSLSEAWVGDVFVWLVHWMKPFFLQVR